MLHKVLQRHFPYNESMDKNAPPSLPMVKKMLRFNGLQEKLDLFFAEYPLMAATPFLVNANKSFLADAAKNCARPEEVAKACQKIYGKYLSAELVLDYIAFIKSPAGQVLIQRDEEIRAELADMMIQISNEIVIDIVNKMVDKNRPPA